MSSCTTCFPLECISLSDLIKCYSWRDYRNLWTSTSIIIWSDTFWSCDKLSYVHKIKAMRNMTSLNSGEWYLFVFIEQVITFIEHDKTPSSKTSDPEKTLHKFVSFCKMIACLYWIAVWQWNYGLHNGKVTFVFFCRAIHHSVCMISWVNKDFILCTQENYLSRARYWMTTEEFSFSAQVC